MKYLLSSLVLLLAGCTVSTDVMTELSMGMRKSEVI